MNVTIPTYKSVLEKDKKVAEAERDTTYNVSKKRVEQTIGQMELSVLTAEGELQKIINKDALDIEGILAARRRIAIAENDVEEAKEVFSQLFPTE